MAISVDRFPLQSTNPTVVDTYDAGTKWLLESNGQLTVQDQAGSALAAYPAEVWIRVYTS